MKLLVNLQEIDTYLIERYALDLDGSTGFSIEVMFDDRVVPINPLRILRVAVRRDTLGDLMDEDADTNAIMKPHEGRIKGGSMRKRDKRFGLDDRFWDWWHRIGKPQNSGRDIETKEEADEWHKIYIQSQFLVRNSLFEKFIHILSSKERERARRLIWIVALHIVRSNNSINPKQLRDSD